jgi:DNA repair protein RadC
MKLTPELSATDAAQADYTGHRARLRARLLDHGGASLQDHELIEYLLALVFKRQDTKPLAKALLREFGGIGPLITADSESLKRVQGMGDGSVAAIKIVQATCLRMLQSAVEDRPMLSSWQALIDYLRADMAFTGIERVRVLHLNTRNILIRDEVMQEGSVDQSAIYVRDVIRRALELGSISIILVHNHPSGDPQPSQADIAVTRSIADAGKRLNIAVHDHIIIGANGFSSLRSMGLI